MIFLSYPRTVPWPDLILDMDRAVERNHRTERLTGVMIFRAAWILQYLEGETATLSHRFDRIAADRRHRMVWSQRYDLAERALPGLPMGYIDAIRESETLPPHLRNQIAGWDRDSAGWLVTAMVAAALRKYPSAGPPQTG